MENFQNRYGINTSIYELCRYKNAKIWEKFIEDKLNLTENIPNLERMLQERVRKLDDYYKISRNEKVFPEVLTRTSYWSFQENKQ